MGDILNNPTDEDARLMKAIENDLIKVLLPYKDRGVSPLLAVLALARCLRTLLRLGTRDEQRTVLSHVEDFLRGRTAPRSELLWTPNSKN